MIDQTEKLRYKKIIAMIFIPSAGLDYEKWGPEASWGPEANFQKKKKLITVALV